MFATIESRLLAYVESGAMASHALGLLLAGKRPAASRAADGPLPELTVKRRSSTESATPG